MESTGEGRGPAATRATMLAAAAAACLHARNACCRLHHYTAARPGYACTALTGHPALQSSGEAGGRQG